MCQQSKNAPAINSPFVVFFQDKIQRNFVILIVKPNHYVLK